MGNDSEFIRGPKWRTRTTPARRRRAAVITFVPIAVVGLFLMVLVIWVLDRLGAPLWLRTLPWWAPTAGVVVWTLVRPSAAVATDDDDDSWAGYAIRYVLVGDDQARPAAIRTIVGVIVGAPVAWSLLLFGVLTLTGVLDM